MVHSRDGQDPGGRRHRLSAFHGDIYVLEDATGDDALHGVGELDDIIARLAMVTASQEVGERERFGELPGPNQEPRAINHPIFILQGHSFSPMGEGKENFRLSIYGLRIANYETFSFEPLPAY
jgi:hypothetical protein